MQQVFRYCVLWLASGRGSLVTGQVKVAQVSLRLKLLLLLLLLLLLPFLSPRLHFCATRASQLQ
jgi:hypothetical protein